MTGDGVEGEVGACVLVGRGKVGAGTMVGTAVDDGPIAAEGTVGDGIAGNVRSGVAAGAVRLHVKLAKERKNAARIQ